MTEFDDRQREREEVWAARGRDRYERAADNLTYRPKRTLAKWAAIFVGILILGTVLSFACGVWSDAKDVTGSYRKEAKRVISAENVKEQNTAIVNDFESMHAAAANACSAGKAAREEGDPTLVESPILAYQATYRRIEVDYNRRLGNLYEAEAVQGIKIIPSDLRKYPKRAPSLEQQMKDICPKTAAAVLPD